jgi:hypothetical protein
MDVVRGEGEWVPIGDGDIRVRADVKSARVVQFEQVV